MGEVTKLELERLGGLAYRLRSQLESIEDEHRNELVRDRTLKEIKELQEKIKEFGATPVE